MKHKIQLIKKIYRDIKEYISGTTNFSLSQGSKKLYPLDLEFTLLDSEFYYKDLDDDGIPYRIYSSVGKQYNPTRIAAYALAHYNRYILQKNSKDKKTFLKMADWFLAISDGQYKYYFDWGELKAPWISCMAQGEAISVLVRAYELTGNEQYLQHAERSALPFFLSIEEGGVASKIGEDYFLEEYPTSNPAHVLNGFLYAVIGLLELENITKNSKNNELIQLLLNTLNKHLEKWSVGLWSLYHIPDGEKLMNYCTPSYHNLQISQLKYINGLYFSPKIEKIITDWEKGADSFGVRLTALYNKVRYRLSNRAQR